MVDKKIPSYEEMYLDIRNFLIKRWAFPENITNRTVINRDIDGDDAIELLEEFSERHEVDMSDFNFGDYFGPECGCNPVSVFIVLYLLITKGKTIENELTVDDLVKAAISHKWEKVNANLCKT